MLVIQGTTPQETKDSIVELIKQEAKRYARESVHQKLKRDAALYKARSLALLNIADYIDYAVLSDLTRKTVDHIVLVQDT